MSHTSSELHNNNQIQIERSQLASRLKQIDNLIPEISQAEHFLQGFQLQVETDTKALTDILGWFEGLKQSFIPNQVWLECQTVLGEAFDNVICHAHEGMPKETPIELKVEIFNQSLIIKIWDYGSGFDLETYYQQKEKEPLDQYAENGRGIQIITEVADYFSYTPQADARNCLLILKSFKPNISSQQQHNSSANLVGYLHALRQLILLPNPQYNQLKDYLMAEKENLINDINQKK